MTAIVIFNVVFAALAVGAILTLLGIGIAKDRAMAQRLPYAPRMLRRPPRISAF